MNAHPQRTLRALRILFVLTVSVASQGTARAQWTQWGGPKQDFTADSKGLASSWPEDGPKKLWTRELGEGYSAILVDDGKLYTMYRSEDNMEAVVALDAKTGKTLWETKYDHSPHKGHVKEFGNGPRSTPLIFGDRLYVVGVGGRLACLNKEDGKEVWAKELWTDMKGSILPHGYASSPVPYKNTVVVLVGGEEQSFVAFNKTDGSIAWKKQSYGNSYSTPKLINLDGEDQLVTFLATEIVGIDPNNGDLKWSYPHQNQWKQNVCMPILGPDNILFFSSPEAGARGLKLTKKGDKTEIEEVWQTRKIQFYHVNSVSVGDYVYGSTGTGQGPAFFAAVNMKTGDIAWRERGLSKATCVYADGKLIILDEDGVLALASCSPEKFEVVSKATVLDKVAWTVPTVVGKTLYVRDQKSIMAFDLG
jgi:outer membrane protein assembly factor BamB